MAVSEAVVNDRLDRIEGMLSRLLEGVPMSQVPSNMTGASASTLAEQGQVQHTGAFVHPAGLNGSPDLALGKNLPPL